MFRIEGPLVFLLLLSLILGACQSEGELSGEVFVATKGGSNVELGDLKVKAIPSSDWEGHLKEKYRRAEKIVAKKVSQTRPLLDSIEDIRAKLEKRRKTVAELRSRFNSASSSLGELSSDIGSDPPSPNEVGKLYATSRARLQQKPLGATITDIQKGTALDPIGREGNFYVVTFSGKKGYVFAEYLVTEQRYKSYQQRKRRQNRRQRALATQLEKAKNRYEDVLQRCKTLRDSLASSAAVGNEYITLPKLLTETSRFRTYKYFLQDTPKPKDTDRTNSEGKFELTLTQGTSYYLIAHRTRSVGASKEEYYWTVETTLRGNSGEVILSNSNMETALPDSLDPIANSSVDTQRLMRSVERCE